MKCPVCKHNHQNAIDLHAEGFSENIFECHVCNSVWSVNHGTLEVIKDTQEKSFLEAISESVEGDDYYLVA